MMKILLAGGGTGGHIYPLIPIGEELRLRGDEVFFVGRRGSIEEHVAKSSNFEVRYIDASQFDLTILRLFKFIISSTKGFFDALRIVSEIHPDAILGGGGYVSLPVLVAGVLKRIPIYLYEQNSIPGRTNLMFKNFAVKVFLGFEDAKEYFLDKGIFTGNPVRKSVIGVDKNQALKFFNFENKFTLLVFGGSGGAYNLNKTVFSIIPELLDKDLQVIFITGTKFFEEFNGKIKHKNLRIFPYLNEMGYAYAVSSIAVTRGGAMTLTELVLNNIYSIVVPFPYARDNHQFYNAKYFEGLGCVSVIEEKDLNGEILLKKILDFKNNFHIIKMDCSSRYPRDAEKKIADVLEEGK